MKRLPLLYLAACLGFCGSGLHAQAVITGTVLDDLGDPAIGATVIDTSVSPPMGTVTDYDGKYRLEVEPGTYALQFSYVGLAPKTVTDIIATKGEVTFLDVSLEVASQEIADVVVTATAIRNTENALILTRLKSDRILDGISSQEMSKLNLSNAASAMTKVTGTTVVDGKYIVVRGLGDRYSTAQLNGLTMPSSDPYRNSPQLDLVPASLLDNIQTSKTFTPDQPGSFTGGNVDLNTKSFPEIKTFKVSVSTGYNTQATFNDDFQTHRGGATDWLGYDDGTRQLPDRIREIGALDVPAGRGSSSGTVRILSSAVTSLNSTDEANQPAFALVEEVADLMPLDFAVQRQSALPDHKLSLSYGNSHDLSGDRRVGYLVSGSFGRNYTYYDNGTAAFYSLNDPDAEALNVEFKFRDTLSQVTPTVSAFAGVGFRLADNQTISALAIYNHTADIGTRNLAGAAPQFNLSETQELNNRALVFLERGTVTTQVRGDHALDGVGDFRLQWAGAYTRTTQDEPNRRLFATVADYADPTDVDYLIPAASISRPLNFFRELEDNQVEGKVDLFYDFDSGHKLQAGVAYRDKTRDFEELIFENRVVQANLPRAYDGNPDNYFTDDNYGFGLSARDRDGVLNYIADNTAPGNSYDGYERIGAAYLMGTYRIGDRLRTIVGARVERTDLRAESRATNVADSMRIGAIEATDVLPSVNLIWTPIERHNVRASFTQTLARPNMREIAPFPNYDFIGGPNFSGNLDLQRSNIDNYDLRYEFYPTSGALLSASTFYKEFRNPIVSTYLPAQQIEFTYVNVPKATVYGLELEARTDLSVVTERLAEVRVGANASLIFSEADVDADELARIRTFDPSFAATRQLQGQSPYIVNANMSWAPERYGFETSVAFNYFGDRLAINGNIGSPDIFERGRGSLDVTLSRSFGPIGVQLSGSNLLNPSYETFAEYRGQDFVYSTFKRGAQFGLTLGYTFQQ